MVAAGGCTTSLCQSLDPKASITCDIPRSPCVLGHPNTLLAYCDSPSMARGGSVSRALGTAPSSPPVARITQPAHLPLRQTVKLNLSFISA